MAIINATPDSFSDGGQLYRNNTVAMDRVLFAAEQMVAEGADILDIGGESTRPGAVQVSVSQELDRVIPVIETLAGRFDVPLSADTSSPQVITAAAAAGACLINDVRALQRDGALSAAVQSGLPVCLMHMQGEPESMQAEPRYQNVVQAVSDFLKCSAVRCIEAGIDKDNIIIDPGFGFGKTLQHNLALFRALPQLTAQGFPVLVGVSRKRMIGTLLAESGVERTVGERVVGSAALALLAVQRGAAIVRVHDVKETADVLKIWASVEHDK